jgi:predicted nucleic-acid-binding Zn-ribbon protein
METPKQQPFSNSVECAKCGSGAVDLKTLPAGIAPRLSGYVTMRYCSGGKEPEAPAEINPLNLAQELIAAATGKPISLGEPVPRGRLNICAGIGEEHLHLTCSWCGYEWLMETKDHSSVVSLRNQRG